MIDVTLSDGESQMVTIDRSVGTDVIPIMTVNVYETGGDEDFQFYITEGQLIDVDEETTTVEFVAENGNADSYVEAHIYFIRPLVAGVEWDLWTFGLANDMVLDQPEGSMIPFNTNEFNTVIFPSLISYYPDNDVDFEAGNFVTVSGEEAAFQLEAQYGNDTSWAAWQHVVIHVPTTE